MIAIRSLNLLANQTLAADLKATFQLQILGVKKNPQSPMYTQLGVLTKGTVIEVNVSELGMVTTGGKVVFGKYAQVTNNPENDGCVNAVLRECPVTYYGLRHLTIPQSYNIARGCMIDLPKLAFFLYPVCLVSFGKDYSDVVVVLASTQLSFSVARTRADGQTCSHTTRPSTFPA